METDVNRLWKPDPVEDVRHESRAMAVHAVENIQHKSALGAFVPATCLARMLHQLGKIGDSGLHLAMQGITGSHNTNKRRASAVETAK